MQAEAPANTEPECHNCSASSENPELHFKALWRRAANDEHSDEEQRDSDPDSMFKKKKKGERGGLFPIFFSRTEIKDENSRPTAANVRLGAHTYRA